MDRESLRPLVEAQFGESHLTVLSEETINAELDEALEGITDDAQVDDAFTKKLATRLLRLNGNVTSEAGRQITDWKKKHPTPKPGTPPATPPKGEEGGDGGEETEMQKLLKRVEAMENAQKQKAVKEANDAIYADVKKGFEAKFKEAGIEINKYILKQTLRDLEIPETEEGEKVNVGDLVKTLERDYLRNMKEAGFDKKETSKPRFGSRGSTGESAADRFFAKKGKREGWKK